MSRFNIKPDSVMNAAVMMESGADKLSSMTSQIEDVMNSLDSGFDEVKPALAAISAEEKNESNDIKKLIEALRRIIEEWKEVEKRIIEHIKNQENGNSDGPAPSNEDKEEGETKPDPEPEKEQEKEPEPEPAPAPAPDPAQEETQDNTGDPNSLTGEERQKMLDRAKYHVQNGTEYASPQKEDRWENNPDGTPKKRDCSSLVLDCLHAAGYENVSGTAQNIHDNYCDNVDCGYPVDLSKLQPGDLIFCSDDGTNISHVVIYIGDGKVIHASSGKDKVVEVNANYFLQNNHAEGCNYLCVGRPNKSKMS